MSKQRSLAGMGGEKKEANFRMYLGVILFLISEAFLFGSLFWTYFYLRIKSDVWPPPGVDLNLGFASLNTAILLASSGAIWLAGTAIRRGKEGALAACLIATILLGSGFLGITFWEWAHESFRPWSHAYGSIFYTLTGFHALHVLGGVLLMAALLIRTLRRRFSSQDFSPVEIGSLYWHFVDFVWLFVFISLFVIR